MLSQRGLAAEERKIPQGRGRITLLTESIAYVGAILVLAGGGVAVGQDWADITNWGRVGIFGSTALFFLAIGLVVLWVTEPAIQRMVGVVWFVSAILAGTAAAIAARDVYGSSGAVTTLVAGLTITLYSALLWLIRRRELQMVALFAGLTVTVCAGIITLIGTTAPWIVFALGLWALGIGWAIVGWQYPQPLGTTVPLGTAIALIGPSFAVWQHPWVYAIGIGTAAAVAAGVAAAAAAGRTAPAAAAGVICCSGSITVSAVEASILA